jgi:hypothetical protein
MTFSFSTFDSFFIVYVTLDINYNMLRLFGTELRLLMPPSLNASSGSLWLYAAVAFFPHVSYNYASAFEHVKLHTLQVRRHRLDALFFIQGFVGPKFCLSLIDNSSL